MPFSISPAAKSDIPALTELEQRVFRPSDGLISQRAFRYHIQRQRNLLLVARERKNPELLAGYILVFIRKHSARVYSLATAPHCRNRGAGRALLQAALEKIEQTGVTRTSLELRKSNQKALALYQSLGFQFTGIRPGYYEDKEEALVMRRQTPPPRALPSAAPPQNPREGLPE